MRPSITCANFHTNDLIAELRKREARGEAIAPFISPKADEYYLTLNQSMDIAIIIRESGFPELSFTFHSRKPTAEEAEAAYELNLLFRSFAEKKAIIKFCRANWCCYGDEKKLKVWLDKEEDA